MSSTLQSLIDQVLAFTVSTDFDFVSLTEFAGYNPAVIFQDVMSKVKNVDDRNHLQFIIYFGLLRGFGGKKDWKTLEERTSSVAGKKMLMTAKSKFGLVLDKSKLTNVTIDRLMGAFPSLTYKIWLVLCGRGLGSSKLPTYAGNLPEKFRYPGSPAAMSANAWTNHKEDYIEWSIEVQHLWKVPNPNREDISKFADLQFQNTLYPMNRRDN
jgi:hypothetical protein